MNAVAVRQVGDAALLFDVRPELRHAAAAALSAASVAGVVDVVPGERSVLVRLDPACDLDAAAESLRTAILSGAHVVQPADAAVVVPVRYDGPDLDQVASITGLAPAEVIAHHVAGAYTVAFMGFAPGFAYLDGLSDALRVPRLATPRTRVEPGSVAIAGSRCCVYPRATPGGWQVIGHTDLVIFDVEATPPTPFAAGRQVRFAEA
jgi:KipI family sensor histidine kinase inhibitor